MTTSPPILPIEFFVDPPPLFCNFDPVSPAPIINVKSLITIDLSFVQEIIQHFVIFSFLIGFFADVTEWKEGKLIFYSVA